MDDLECCIVTGRGGWVYGRPRVLHCDRAGRVGVWTT